VIDTSNYKQQLKNYKYIDLFAGIGGFRLALDSFGAKCVFSSDIDKYAQEVYNDNFGELPEGDITEINEEQIPSHDILCAGFPCQAFSISGKQRGFEDTRGTLFFDIARIAKQHKPKMLFLENVKNFERHDHGRTLEIVLKNLSDLNYDSYYKVLDASNFGVPQKRERIYILAFQKYLNVTKYEFPKPKIEQKRLRDILLSNSETKKYFKYRKDVTLKNNLIINKDMFGKYPNKSIRIGTVNNGGQGDRIYHIDGQAITLSAYGGGTGAKTGLYLVENQVRKLAPRECARLMGFPDSFKLHKSDSQSFKQLGNSIVVNVLQHILISLLEKGILK
jgi:DNA (cytosine-5)-methyltransferase 1